MKIIKLSNSAAVTQVDDDVFEAVKHYRWRLIKEGYVVRTVYSPCAGGGKKSPHMSLHRWILQAKPGQIVDHKDGNRLNNTRDNLRFATASQNAFNRGDALGVTWNKRCKKWQAAIGHERKKIYLGVFVNYEDAVAARRRSASALFGDFVRQA